jgi:hypothetical protein
MKCLQISPWIAITLIVWIQHANAQIITAYASAQLSQFDEYVTRSYTGEVANLPIYQILTSSPPDINRFGEASVSSSGIFSSTRATGSGIAYPSSGAGIGGLQLVIENTPAFEAAITANGGQPIQLFARFYVAFTRQNTPNPGGVFNQTTTNTSVTIDVAAVDTNSLSGEVSGSNGPYDDYTNNTSGFATPSRVNAGMFAVDVPFSIDLSHLTATFSLRVSSSSLSLDLETNSSVMVRFPSKSDIFLQSGQAPSTNNISYSFWSQRPDLIMRRETNESLSIIYSGTIQESEDLVTWKDMIPQPNFRFPIQSNKPKIFYRARTN